MARPKGIILLLTAATAVFIAASSFVVEGDTGATQAPTGFDNLTNGFLSQPEFDEALETFEERDGIDEGLGPVYNAQSCAECHQSPITGGISQISELRAGHRDGVGNFVDAPGGSLINDRAIRPSIQEHVPDAENVRTFRMSTNVLGLGFVEAINSNTLVAIASAQPTQSGGRIAGMTIQVPVLESAGAMRTGRFGWKNQHASLLSFAADAYLNEIGVTSRFALLENTSMDRSVALHDTTSDPEDETDASGRSDIDLFADFMRSTKAPPSLALTSTASAGATLFNQVGCNICHVSSITTSPVGTIINGAMVVPAALGNKIIHPYSDFLLHDVGTGDGIVQNGGQATANKLRTVPLWGLRTHDRHMHDGQSLTVSDAILRHAGEATFVTNNYRALNATQKNQILAFLKSL